MIAIVRFQDFGIPDSRCVNRIQQSNNPTIQQSNNPTIQQSPIPLLPLHDVIPTRTRPIATLAIVAIHVVAWATGLGAGDAPWIDIAARFFAHTGWVHLAADAIAIWLFGPSVEDRLGPLRFVALYLLGGAAAAGLAASQPDAIAPLGAPGGAVAAILAAHFVLFPSSRMLVLAPATRGVDAIELPALFFAGLWFGMETIGGLGWPVGATPLTVIGGLAAGLVVGAAAVLLLRRPERLRVEWWNDR
jgi:membrane associated rhomboid family serine protease